MFKLSRKVLFAIEAVVDIAYHSGGQPVQSKEITRRQGIPRRYLEQVLQHLVRAEILVGVRGPRGGYNMARERRRVSVGEIIRVVRALETASDPLDMEESSELAEAVIRPLWGELQDEVMQRLDKLSVDDLCNRAHTQGVESEGRQYLDFSI
jgi:Rrf2 family iron-sulfur cluster assembly transcriptional regulator